MCSNLFYFLQSTITTLVHCIVGYNICCSVLCCVQNIFLNVHGKKFTLYILLKQYAQKMSLSCMFVWMDVFLKAVPAGFHCERLCGATQRLTIVFPSFTSAAPSFNRTSSRQKRNCESHTNRKVEGMVKGFYSMPDYFQLQILLKMLNALTHITNP